MDTHKIVFDTNKNKCEERCPIKNQYYDLNIKACKC